MPLAFDVLGTQTANQIQGGATRCLHAVGPGRPDGWLQWAKFYEGIFIKILGGRNMLSFFLRSF